MENYVPNSNKYREEHKNSEVKPKAQSVVSNQVTLKKKNGVQKAAGSFLHLDGKEMKEYLILDVLVPTIKKTISTCVDRMLYGRDTRNSNVPASKVAYGSMYGNKRYDERPREENRTRSALDYDDIEFYTRGDAEVVLDKMFETISKYGVVSIGDMYDFAGLSNYNHCIHKYGWIDLRSAEVVSLWNGKYTLKLPKAAPIE